MTILTSHAHVSHGKQDNTMVNYQRSVAYYYSMFDSNLCYFTLHVSQEVALSLLYYTLLNSFFLSVTYLVY